MNSCKLDNKTDCIIIINTTSLLEPFSHQKCFIMVNGPFSFTLDFIDPFVVDKITTSRWRNEMLGLTLHESRVLRIHRSLPL
jgi:hypothetical protein